jgi:hypothetical protein
VFQHDSSNISRARRRLFCIVDRPHTYFVYSALTRTSITLAVLGPEEEEEEEEEKGEVIDFAITTTVMYIPNGKG